jgi:twitching motility protein PilI
MSLSPFALLKQIAERCRSHAADLPSRVEAVEYWRGVGFMLAGRRYVAAMSDVSEILKPPRLTKLPGVKHWVQGVANVRGKLVPVMELASFLGERAPVSSRTRRVLVVEKEELINGLLVDHVLGMQHFPKDKLEHIAEQDVPERIRPFVVGCYRRGGEIWPVFSFDALVESDLYMDIAV